MFPRPFSFCLFAALLGLFAARLSAASSALPDELGEVLAGGKTSVRQDGRTAFLQPANNLSLEGRLDFAAGRSFFRSPWVRAPTTTTARDGLGPLFNGVNCQGCHIRGGRGQPPAADSTKSAFSMLLRLSIPPQNAAEHALLTTQGVVPEPTYGGQLQDMANPGVAPEGRLRLAWQPHQVEFADGFSVELQKPVPLIERLAYGDLHKDTLFSLRVAPPTIGLGLLEAIPEQAILANAKAQQQSASTVNGKPNWVWDIAQGKTVLGRFGWKAGQPNLNQQNANAFVNDLGLTSSLFPKDSCTQSQEACLQSPNGGEPEVSDNILRLVLHHTRHLAVPVRRNIDAPEVRRGQALFAQAGCAQCHQPSWRTAKDAAEPALSNQLIWPYSDLLLHDMGEGLADGRPEFAASGRQWRTPPLWGIGLAQQVNPKAQFLHDARARTLLEAILWHGGEAEPSRAQVLAFDSDERSALLAFLNSL